MNDLIKLPCIVGIGELLFDIFPYGKKLGGAPLNFAFHAQSLGAECYPVSSVADDELGTEILKRLKDIGLDDTYISITDKGPTGTVRVKLDSEGIPDFTINENVAWDYIPFTAELKELASRADAVCYGSLAQRSKTSRETIRSFIKETKDRCLRVYDVNLRQAFYNKSVLRETLVLSDVMKLNNDELSIISELFGIKGSESEILISLLHDFGLEMIALTNGDKGSRLFSLSQDSIVKAPKIKVADTVGAGDAFTAALVVGLLKDYAIEIIHQNATNLSAFVCTHKGATPKLPKALISKLITT
ncbi:carbohydrate kinase [bacterium]|nr:carbohydrate kinase [bacterium]